MVFLVLGINIPNVLGVIFQNHAFDNLSVISYVLAITALLIVLRFLWVYMYSFWESRLRKMEKAPIKSQIITAISGVRGAVQKIFR